MGSRKFNCLFCSYANGLIAYVREIAARTEHTGARSATRAACAALMNATASFAAYGDPRGYRAQLAALRASAKR